MAAIVHGLEDKFGNYMNFVYLDVDQNVVDDICDDLDFYAQYVPTFLFISSDGEIIRSPLIGSQDSDYMEQVILDVLVDEGVINY